MNIESLMNREVYTCRAEDSLNLAARLMWEGDVGCIPVIDADRKPIGVITDRDIAMAAFLSDAPLSSQQVSRSMSKAIRVARVGQSVHSAAELMRTEQLHRLPVVDADGKLAGIVSINDLALAAGSRSVRPLKTEELAATLASICQPRRQRGASNGKDA